MTAPLPNLKRILLSSVLACVLLAGSVRSINAAEFTEESEKIIPLRSRGRLEITNNRGAIIVEGWVQDKIKIKAKRRASAESVQEARKLFGAADFRYRVSEGNIELSAEYGQGLTMEERLKERASPRTSMDMHVLAPTSLPLRIWAANGKVVLKSWKAAVEVRAASGEVLLSGVKGPSISVLCPGCAIEIEGVQGSVRCMAGSGSVRLRHMESPQVYAETGEGSLHVESVAGEQLYVSKTGALTAINSSGHIEFNMQQGTVRLDGVEGSVSGRTGSGNIEAGIRRWNATDKAFIESISGNILFRVPAGFSSELDIRSAKGSVELAVPLRAATRGGLERSATDANHFFGVTGEGGELLKIFSETGSIKVVR